jgi:hypothetical protein
MDTGVYIRVSSPKGQKTDSQRSGTIKAAPMRAQALNKSGSSGEFVGN